jgi:hypothetical protein
VLADTGVARVDQAVVDNAEVDKEEEAGNFFKHILNFKKLH